MQVERIGPSGLIGVPLTRQVLIRVKTRALRKRVWYRALSRIERGLVDLTIRWVDKVKNKAMSTTLLRILQKLTHAFHDRIFRALKNGRILACGLSELGSRWGNQLAYEWRYDRGFAVSLGLGITVGL